MCLYFCLPFLLIFAMFVAYLVSFIFFKKLSITYTTCEDFEAYIFAFWVAIIKNAHIEIFHSLVSADVSVSPTFS